MIYLGIYLILSLAYTIYEWHNAKEVNKHMNYE